jgi:hypothetical protein
MSTEFATIGVILSTVGVLISLIIVIYQYLLKFRVEREDLRATIVKARYETEKTVEESLKEAGKHIQKPSDLIPLVNEKIKEIELELKNTKDDISPFLQLIKSGNPKFTTVEGYFFFYLMNQIREDLDRVQGNIMTDVDDKIATHFSRINLIFGILTAILIGMVLININLFLEP